MKYKSPYRTAILLQRKLLLEKEREIAVFHMEKNKLQLKIDEYKEREHDFYQLLIDETEFDVNMLNRRFDKKGKKALLVMLEEVDKKIHQLNIEYMTIKNKIENIEELDKEKEKEFNKEKMKKESKKIEGVMLVKKWKGEDEGWR